MNIFFGNKLARGIALVPVGIGSVIGTVYLTNLNKPLDLLDSFSFNERPEVAEELLNPIVIVGGSGGGGGGSSGGGTDPSRDGGSGDGQGPGENGSETDIGSGKSEQEPAPEVPQASEEQTEESTTDPEFVGAEPTTIIQQVISNISGLDLTKNMSLPVIFWLLKNLQQGTLAVKQIQNNEKKAKENGQSNTDSSSEQKTS